MATQKQEFDKITSMINSHIEDSRAASDRMNRIETKMDQLADAVISIARAEEKIAILMQDTKDIKEAVTESTSKIHNIELRTERHSSEIRTMAKFFWIVIGAAVVVVTTAVAVSVGLPV